MSGFSARNSVGKVILLRFSAKNSIIGSEPTRFPAKDSGNRNQSTSLDSAASTQRALAILSAQNPAYAHKHIQLAVSIGLDTAKLHAAQLFSA